MDFGTLLNVAQKNGTNSKQRVACYQTKFAPPKKIAKQTKSLSDNIKKFLARRDEEERQKNLEEKKKRENLLALRDHKAQSRINKHLKVCKAANKSVLADAIDNDNTAVTMAGPSQPDEDDYGYVSQEASAFYNQLMNKYNAAPQRPLFHSNGKKTVKDIASTKDRVKQALRQQEEEAALGHRRKRKSTSGQKGAEGDEGDDESLAVESEKDKDKDEKPKQKRKLAPPPIDFGELLKLAEKKQHEPVMIEVKPKLEEPERLMTKKQMQEYFKEKEAKERREQREKGTEVPAKIQSASNTTGKTGKAQLGKIPKTSSASSEKTEKPSGSTANSSASSKAQTKPVIPATKKLLVSEKITEKSVPSKSSVPKTSEKDLILEERKKLEAERRKLEEMRQAIEEEKKRLAKNKSKQEKPVVKAKQLKKPDPPKEVKPKPTSTPPVGGPSQKPRVPPILNGKPKQFPPPDLKSFKSKPNVSKDMRKPNPAVHKRRIYDEDEEYDSELDDFIDDGPVEESEDYSKYISEIFGYDKSRYRYVDSDEDDARMESSFAQQLKEEYVSTKIGIMEDLEDMRMEALEKKRKALIRKKLKK